MTYNTYIPGIKHSKERLIHKLDRLEVDCGTAVNSWQLEANDGFLARNFQILAPEVEGKMAAIRKAPDVWDFSGMDKICAFARKHELQVHWHCLAWNNYNPAWWLELDPQSQQAAMKDFVIGTLDYIARRWGDVVSSVDVLNEYISDKGWPYGAELDKAGITPHLVYSWARQSSYQGRLYYNDFVMTKAWQVAVFNQLIMPGLVDGLGLQFHFGDRFTVDDDFTHFVSQAAKYVTVSITECDVCTMNDAAAVYREIIRWVKDNPVDRLSFWGFDCNSSWLKPRGCINPLPWAGGMPTINYHVMMDEL